VLDFGDVSAKRLDTLIIEVEFPAAGKTLKRQGGGLRPEKNAVGGQALKIMHGTVVKTASHGHHGDQHKDAPRYTEGGQARSTTYSCEPCCKFLLKELIVLVFIVDFVPCLSHRQGLINRIDDLLVIIVDQIT